MLLTFDEADNVEDKEENVGDNERHLRKACRIFSNLLTVKLQLRKIVVRIWHQRSSVVLSDCLRIHLMQNRLNLEIKLR